MKVIRDNEGNVINFGDWDYKEGEDGVACNPLPEGSIESDEQVEILEDGTPVVSTDYEKKRQLEYPSIVDQLDYIYHNGIEAWKTDMIQPVKDKHVKN